MKSLFPEHFQRHRGILQILKQIAKNSPFFVWKIQRKCYKSLKLFHTFSLRHKKLGSWRVNLLNFWHWTGKQNIFTNIFLSNMVLKCEAFKILLSNVKISFEWRGIFEIVVIHRYGHKNLQFCQNPQQVAKNWEIIFFPTRWFDFKCWQPCLLKSSFDFEINVKILIISKMPFLILSTILDLMLALGLVNYFGNLGR